MTAKQVVASTMQGLGLAAVLVGAYLIAVGLAIGVAGVIAVGVGVLLERRAR